MNSGQLFSILFVVAIIGIPTTVHSWFTTGLNNPFASLSLKRNEASDVVSGLSGVMNEVRRMQIKKPLSSLLLRGEPMTGPMANVEGKKKLQSSFNWTSCGSSKQVMEIKSLNLKPSPISFPGTITFGFDIVFHETILPSEKVKVELELDVGKKIKIPCFGLIGSCTYDDLCSMLKGVSCPSLEEKKIPCRCPFEKGEYVLNDYSVTILSEVFPGGDYVARANITTSTKEIGCYELKFTVLV